MNPQILSIVLSVVMVIAVLLLLRSYVLPEKYAVIWLLAAVAALVLSIFPGLLDAVAGFFGIQQPINLLFVGVFFVMVLILMQVSLELSKARDEFRRFVQRSAIENEERLRERD